MANHNVSALVKAVTSGNPQTQHLQREVAGDDASLRDGRRFTDTELAAAQQLVLLSESSSEDAVPQAASRASSSSSSSAPSVTNARLPPPAATVAVEEDWFPHGPSARNRRYRSIRTLYEVTIPIGADGARSGASHRGTKRRTYSTAPYFR